MQGYGGLRSMQAKAGLLRKKFTSFGTKDRRTVCQYTGLCDACGSNLSRKIKDLFLAEPGIKKLRMLCTSFFGYELPMQCTISTK
ncbi:hypothetical protein ACFXTH_010276 [Malus domestica]